MIDLKCLKSKMEIAVSRENFTALRNQPFTIIPDCLLKAINKELTGTARALYIYLYSLSERNFNNKKSISPVIISANSLADYAYKSERTIRRRLAELISKGFIVIENRYDATHSQSSNAIWPVIPERLRQDFLNQPSRKNISKRHHSDNRNSINIKDESVLSDQDFIKNSENKSLANSNSMPDTPCFGNLQAREVYELYTIKVKELQATGISVAKANMRAYQELSSEQKSSFNNYLKQETIKTTNLEITKALEKDLAPHDKNGIRKIYNNIYVNNSTYFVDKSLEAIETKFQNKHNVVELNKKITPRFIAQAISKIKHKIPTSVLSHGRTIQDIILEVQFHVEHRDHTKTKSPLHALNAAKSLLMRGVWGVPKKYIFRVNIAAIAREKEAQAEKILELQQIRQFINNRNEGEPKCYKHI